MFDQIIPQAAPLAIFIALLFVVVTIFSAFMKRAKRGKPSHITPRRNMRDPAQQMDAVAQIGFQKTRLLNKEEYRALIQLEAAAAEAGAGFRVMAQTNLGEFLRPDPSAPPTLKSEAQGATNSKRVDFLIIDRSGYPVLAVEVQGSGHHIGKTAFMRDAVKREALRKAGIPLLEVTPDMSPGLIAGRARQMLGAAQAA